MKAELAQIKELEAARILCLAARLTNQERKMHQKKHEA